MLEEEERKRNARQKMQDAMRTNDWSGLKDTIAQCEAAGLTDDELRPAREALLGEERRARAREALQTAMANADVDALRAAVEEGEAAGLSPDELAAARGALGAEARKQTALDELAGATGSGDIDRLRHAVAEAEAAGVDDPALDAARRALDDLERKEDARRRLEEASRQDELEALRAALDDAEDAGLPEEELAATRRTLADKTRQLEEEAAAAALQQTLAESMLESAEEDGPKATTTTDTRTNEKASFACKPGTVDDSMSDEAFVAALKQRLRKIHVDPAEALSQCMCEPSVASMDGNSDAPSTLPRVDVNVVVSFAGQLNLNVNDSRAEDFLANVNAAEGGPGKPCVDVPAFLRVLGSGSRDSAARANSQSFGGARSFSASMTMDASSETPRASGGHTVEARQQRKRELQQQTRPSERLRQMVLQQRVERLSEREAHLVTQLREALFERRSSMSKMFQSVDLNEDGTVTLEEFMHTLEGCGAYVGHEIDRARADVDEEEAARVLAFFDRDGRGVLRYNEFIRLLQGALKY